MNTREALKLAIDGGENIAMAYLGDLTDQEMLHRPCPGINHINWQVGHLISSEHGLMEKIAPGSMPPLPEGFKDKYAREKCEVDYLKELCTKAELLAAHKAQRDAILATLAKMTDADLDTPSGWDFCPTWGAVFNLQGGHWLMHCGQWAVIRRQLGRKPLF